MDKRIPETVLPEGYNGKILLVSITKTELLEYHFIYQFHKTIANKLDLLTVFLVSPFLMARLRLWLNSLKLLSLMWLDRNSKTIIGASKISCVPMSLFSMSIMMGKITITGIIKITG